MKGHPVRGRRPADDAGLLAFLQAASMKGRPVRDGDVCVKGPSLDMSTAPQ